MGRVFLLAFTLVVIAACNDEPDINRNTIEYFREHLRADMTHNQLKATFGEPDDDIGSGLHIYVYQLDDDTKVIIGCTDKIFSARHVDADDNLLQQLL